MTIDERLEALTQSVELLYHSQRGQDARFAAMQQETEKRFADVSRLFAETDDFINRLAHVAEAHQKRIENLENQ